MSLINETFSSLPNELSSIEYKHMSCVANAELWLLIYLIIKTVIEIVLYHFYIVFPLSLLSILISPHQWRHAFTFIFDYSWLHTLGERERYWYFTILKQEMMLIYVYSYISYISTLEHSKNFNVTTTYMMFLRWSIEGSNIPMVLFFTIFIPHTEFLNSFSNYYQLFYCSTMFFKLPLLLFMRGTEQEPDSVLNAVPQFLFNKLCFGSSK